MKNFLFCVTFAVSHLFLSFSISETSAAIVYDENGNFGSLSTDKNNPTNLLNPLNVPGMDMSLPIGISSIQAVVESAGGIGDVDYYRFNIAPGTILTEMHIPIYTSEDMIAVMAITSGTIFPFDHTQFNNTITPTQLEQVLGVAQFGTGWDNTTGSFSRDLLQGSDPLLTPANLFGSRANGFKPIGSYGPNDPFDFLPAGDYTIYVQQSGANTEYQLDLTVAAVPEPTSIALVGLVGVSFFGRRRRVAV